MPPLTVLIKPASSDCNLRCRYCFYRDETDRRQTPSFGRMSEETLENVIKKVMSKAEGTCTIGFQGGEPTLAGLEFFRRYIALVKKYRRRGLQVFHTIQTNGTLLTPQWAQFLAENRFLVGLSMDGPAHLHDAIRVNSADQGSFDAVWHAKELLEKYKVDFNVLVVVTHQNAKRVDELYRFFTENNLWYQQYIPCLAPLDAEGCGTYALSAEDYGLFLRRLFDLWYADRCKGREVYIRYFENLAGMLMGYPPENCGMCGRCVNQYVVEADGSVYPCDFYVLDEFYLGNFNKNTIEEIDVSAKPFIETSLCHEEECQSCQYFTLCRGGCRRDRQRSDMVSLGKSCYCEAYKSFLPHAVPRLIELIRNLRQ